MTAAASGRPAPAQALARATARLARHVGWSSEFWLAYIFTVDLSSADHVRSELDQALQQRSRTLRRLRPAAPSALLPSVASHLGSSVEETIWLEAVREPGGLDSSEEWTNAWTNLALRLNERRQLVRETFNGGLILVAHPELKSRLRGAAPDLWSVRTFVFDLPAAALPPPVLPADGPLWIERASFVDGRLLARQLAHDSSPGTDTPQQQARGSARLATRLWSTGRAQEALEHATLAVRQYGALPLDPATRTDLGDALSMVSGLQRSTGNHAAAIAAAREAVEVLAPLQRDDRPSSSDGWARALVLLGLALSRAGRSADAQAPLQEAVTRLRSQVANDSGTHYQLMALSEALGALGHVMLQLRRWEQGLAYYREVIEGLSEYLPLNVPSADALAAHSAALSAALIRLARAPEARELVDDAYASYEFLANNDFADARGVQPPSALRRVAQELVSAGHPPHSADKWLSSEPQTQSP